MQLVLRLPEGWKVRELDGGRSVIRLPSDVEIEVDAFVATPDEPRLWIEQTMLRATPFASRLRDMMPVLARNELGWPMEVTSAAVVDPDGKLLEARIGAFYKFQEWAGSALARSANVAALEELRGSIVEVLQSARPDWRSPLVVTAISELWE